MKQTIAIVEDDPQQRRCYADALRANDYSVVEFADRQAAIDHFNRQLPDLAILDIALGPDIGGGYEICRYLQQSDASLPVIFLTSRGDELDRIYGLQLGAWDYQTKPVSLDFLIVRVKSFFQIKQHTGKNETDNRIKTGSLTLNTGSMQCYWKGGEISLTPTEFSILNALATSPAAVSTDDLVKSTKQGIVEDNTINTHILHIRKKLRKVDSGFDSIKTRYGFGYQWIGPVNTI